MTFTNTKELLTYLKEHAETSFFRGQSPETRILNSTLPRELRGETKKLPRNYIPEPPLSSWNIANLYGYHQTLLFEAFNYDDVLILPNGDKVLELVKHLQQKKKNPKVRGHVIEDFPTPALEFSEDWGSRSNGTIKALKKGSPHETDFD